VYPPYRKYVRFSYLRPKTPKNYRNFILALRLLNTLGEDVYYERA
jgi:hypothetical protein